MANVPDFFTLANQQSEANNAATNATNTANRSNQYGSMGSSTWSMGPNGQWTNTLDLDDPQQNLFNTTIAGQQGLSGTLAGGLNFGSAPAMPQVGQYNQQVIDAWNALQQPGLDRSADASRARMAAMGLTQGSTINNNNERNIGNVQTDARNKAILAGYTQGNTEFDQALRARAQGTGEAKDAYQAAISGSSALGSIRDSLNPNKWLGEDKTSAGYAPKNIYGAAMDTYNAQLANENSAIANRNSNINTGAGVVGALGGLNGIGGLLGGAGNALSNWWSGGTNYMGDSGNNWSSGNSNSLDAWGNLNGWWGTGG